MLTLVIFILVISVLVLVHEAGHFFAAKRAGMKVEEFGLGFPPRAIGIKRGGTVYSLNWIPFGGFVRIYGEDGEHRTAPGSFGGGSFRSKVGVIVAGVVMNLLFAAFLLILGNFLGLRVGLFDEVTTSRAHDKRVEILEVLAGSPAEKSGLRQLDQIIGFREGGALMPIDSPEDVQSYAKAHQGTDVAMVIKRGSSVRDVDLLLRQSAPGEGPIGIALALTGVVRYPWYESLWRGVADTGLLFWAILKGYWTILSSLFTSGSLGADVSGPVGIATLTGQAARVGFNYLMQFVAMISINLAVLNILPFPALDGGRLAIILAEKARGRALGEHTERLINTFGFAVLLALMVAVTVKDIVQFF